MTERVTPERFEEYDAFVRAHPKGHFMQTRAGGAHKSSWKWVGILCRGEDGAVKGSYAVQDMDEARGFRESHRFLSQIFELADRYEIAQFNGHSVET